MFISFKKDITECVSIHRIENDVSVVAMDSHPKRTNGFLTGCLQSVLTNTVYARPFIEELPR